MHNPFKNSVFRIYLYLIIPLLALTLVLNSIIERYIPLEVLVPGTFAALFVGILIAFTGVGIKPLSKNLLIPLIVVLSASLLLYYLVKPGKNCLIFLPHICESVYKLKIVCEIHEPVKGHLLHGRCVKSDSSGGWVWVTKGPG